MQFKVKVHELGVYLSLRPSNYLFGRVFRFKKIMHFKSLGYIVNDPAIAKIVLRDSEHFSIKDAGGLGSLIAELWGTTPTLLSMDGDEHKRIKYALLELLQDEKLPEIIGKELARFKLDLSDKITQPDGVDIAKETRIATNRITMKLLGVSDISDAELLRIGELVYKVMSCIDLRHKTFTKKNRAQALHYVDDLKQIAESFYKNIDTKQDSIIGRLQQLGYSGEASYGFIAMFIVAGTVTVSSALPRIANLLIETGQLSKLHKNPTHIENAVSEGLRYTTPGPILLHGIKKSVKIGKYELTKDDRVIILMYNIMHNPKYTSEPFTFDIDRKQHKDINGLWFGTGTHFCMGSVLAIKEITAAINALTPFSDTITVKSRSYMQYGINPGYKSLILKASR